MTTGGESEMIEVAGDAFPSGEFRQFLEADGLEVEPDRVFKERLRRRLWLTLRSQLGLPEESDPPSEDGGA